MRRILIICNTHFQIIVALQLKLTLFMSDEVDIHISDHSLNAASVAARLCQTGLFHEVCYRETKAEIAAGNIRKARGFVDACFGMRRYPVYPDYDEVLFYNLNIPVYHVADAAKNGSRRTIFSGMEEGILSYGRMAFGKSPEILDKVRTITNRPQIMRSIARYYCFLPELYRTQGGAIEPVRIPSVHATLDELRKTLVSVFDFNPTPIPQKYIFFASSSDVDGNGFGETELVLNLAELLGRENLLVKMHPRDGRSVYRDAGLNVMARSDVPWEVVQFCGVADQSLCMTATSGAFINPAALLGSKVKGVFWSLDRPENTALNNRMNFIETTLRRLHEAGTCKGIQVACAKDASNVLPAFFGTAGASCEEGAV